MKQALLIMLLVCPFALGFGSSTVFAQQSGGGNYPAGGGVRVKEVDGAPNVPGTQTLVFPNGSLTRAGQTVTVTLSGGGLTVGTTTITSGTTTRVLYDNAGVVGEYPITGTGNVVLSASPTLTGTVGMAAQTNTGTIVQTSASATAFESGPNGSTNPVFRLVNSTASSATGISVTGAAAGSGVTLAAISSGTNEGINVLVKGTDSSFTVTGAGGTKQVLANTGVTPKATIQILSVGDEILYINGANAYIDSGTVFQRYDTSKLAWFFTLDQRAASERFKLSRLSSGGAVTYPFTVDSAGDAVTLSGGQFGFSSSSTDAAGGGAGSTADVAIARQAYGVLRITKDATGAGSLVLGTSTVGSIGTSGVGVLAIANGTAPSSSPADEVQLYAEDVSSSSELKVRDEAGNITVLSPHDFSAIPNGRSEPMAWAFYSERDGTVINVDMLRVVRLLEKLTGEKLVFISRKPVTNH